MEKTNNRPWSNNDYQPISGSAESEISTVYALWKEKPPQENAPVILPIAIAWIAWSNDTSDGALRGSLPEEYLAAGSRLVEAAAVGLITVWGKNTEGQHTRLPAELFRGIECSAFPTDQQIFDEAINNHAPELIFITGSASIGNYVDLSVDAKELFLLDPVPLATSTDSPKIKLQRKPINMSGTPTGTAQAQSSRRTKGSTVLLSVQNALTQLYPGGKPLLARKAMHESVQKVTGKIISIKTLDRACDALWKDKINPPA